MEKSKIQEIIIEQAVRAKLNTISTICMYHGTKKEPLAFQHEGKLLTGLYCRKCAGRKLK